MFGQLSVFYPYFINSFKIRMEVYYRLLIIVIHNG